jgi:AbrB family looped-hinge helix DNA binding protein
MSATVTSKGQVTIPKEVREKLNLQTGDKLEFLVQEDGTAKVVPVTSSVKELKGMIPKPKKAVSLEDMDKAIAKGAGS